MCIHASTSKDGTLSLRLPEGIRKEGLHRRVVEQDAAENRQMPQVVASANVVKHARAPTFGNLAGVHKGAEQVHKDTLGNRRVEFPDKVGPVGEVELQDWQESRCAKPAEEGDAGPCHLGSVKGWVPWEDDAADAEDCRRTHVQPAADGVAVEGRVLGRDDGRCNEQRDTCVVNARKDADCVHVGNGVHGMPDCRAYQRQTRREEEDGGNKDIRLGAELEVDVARVEVEGDGENNEETNGVGPNVDQLVRGAEGRPDALELGLGKTVPITDVRVDAPRHGEVVVGDEFRLPGPRDGVGNLFLQTLSGAHGSLNTLVDDLSREPDALVHNPSALVHKGACRVGGIREALLPQLVRLVLKLCEHVVQKLDTDAGLLIQGFGRGQGSLVPGLECLHHDVQAPASGAEDLLRGRRAASADGLEGGKGTGYARVESELTVVFEKFEAAFQFG